MKKEAIQGFTARITQANKTDLIVILYEMLLLSIKEAKEAHKKEDFDTYDKELKQAQRFISELMGVLDYQYALSYDLLSLYLYVHKRLITAIMKREPSTLSSAESVLNKLMLGFEGVSKLDHSGPVMQNSQQLYAGLTYGKGTLNETYIDPSNKNRGFIA